MVTIFGWLLVELYFETVDYCFLGRSVYYFRPEKVCVYALSRKLETFCLFFVRLGLRSSFLPEVDKKVTFFESDRLAGLQMLAFFECAFVTGFVIVTERIEVEHCLLWFAFV